MREDVAGQVLNLLWGGTQMAEPDFDEHLAIGLRHVIAGGQGMPSPDLEPLLHTLHAEVARRPAGLRGLRDALVALLRFLTSPEGRTDANFRLVDRFATMAWADEVRELPDAFARVFDDLQILHDTFGAPDVARSFEATPEQLLERARRL